MMKKLKAIFLTIISVFCLVTLASCGKSAKVEVVNITAMRTRIGVTIKIDDPKTYITKGSVTATLFETTESGDTVGTLTFDSLEEDDQTKTFDDLKRETTYKLVIKATVDDKSVTYYNKKVTTTNEGSSAENPISITTKEEFLAMSYDNDAYYKLMNNLDFTNEKGEKTDYASKFDANTQFLGHFDGNGKTIKGAKIVAASGSTGVYLGLFGYLGIGSNVSNLNLEDISITSTKGSQVYFGALAGCNQGTITNVTAKNISIEHMGTSTTQAEIGGLVGVNCYKILNSSVDGANISVRTRKQNSVGGFVGNNGGIVQNSLNGAIIDNCFAKAVKIKNEFTSTIVVDKKTSASPEFFSYTGGFVGESRLDITNSFADSTIEQKVKYASGTTLKMYEIAIGGFAGRVVNNAELKSSVSKTTITFETADAYSMYVGALIGRVIDSVVTDSVGFLSKENSVINTADYAAVEDQDIVKLFIKHFDGIGSVDTICETNLSNITNSGYALTSDATVAVDAEGSTGHMALENAPGAFDSSKLTEKVLEFFNSIE